MAVGKEIRTKIGSIRNTQKITNAMQMVAASKMRKTQEKMAASKPYSERISTVIGHISQADTEYRNDYMIERETKRVGYIVISTDRGLCGGLNVNLFKSVSESIKVWQAKGVQADFCVIGNKAASFFRSVGGNVIAAINGIGEKPTPQELVGGIKVMIDAYDEGKIDRIYVCYNSFVNTMTQQPIVDQLVPLKHKEQPKYNHHWDYIYEPEAKEILEQLIVRYIESQVYQAVVENNACEQAARMMAMKNATDNAGDLINNLQLIYNKARQAAITQEISEICSGAAAV